MKFSDSVNAIKKNVKSGDKIFIHGGQMAPRRLVKTFAWNFNFSAK